MVSHSLFASIFHRGHLVSPPLVQWHQPLRALTKLQTEEQSASEMCQKSNELDLGRLPLSQMQRDQPSTGTHPWETEFSLRPLEPR